MLQRYVLERNINNELRNRNDLERLINAEWLECASPFWPIEKREILAQALAEKLSNEEIAPPFHQIFRAFEQVLPSEVKVVILGQDPYPTSGHAHGLAFSTNPGVQPFPKSLRNIFKELKRSMPSYEVPWIGDLTSWAEQGVLLLNTVLTTRVGTANAHVDIEWQSFTQAVLQGLNEQKKGLIGLFWGEPAKKMANLWGDDQHKLMSSHPSPLSAHRGFLGCNHFVEANILLKSQNKSEILW